MKDYYIDILPIDPMNQEVIYKKIKVRHICGNEILVLDSPYKKIKKGDTISLDRMMYFDKLYRKKWIKNRSIYKRVIFHSV